MSSITFYRYIGSVLIFFQAEHLGQNQFSHWVVKSRINAFHSYILLPFHLQPWTIYLLWGESQINIRWYWKQWSYEMMISKDCFLSSALSGKVHLLSLSPKMFSHITCTWDSDIEASKLRPRPRTLTQSKNTSWEFIKQTSVSNVFSTLPDNSKAMPPTPLFSLLSSCWDKMLWPKATYSKGSF